MYRHYHSALVNDNDLDRMFAEAEAEEKTPTREPRYVIIEAAVDEHESSRLRADADAEAADDEVIDGSVEFVLEYLADVTRDDLPRGIAARDIWDAIQATGLVLGTVFESPGRREEIVELDYDACTDAIAWAVVTDLPEWVVSRYRKLLSPGIVP